MRERTELSVKHFAEGITLGWGGRYFVLLIYDIIATDT